MFQRDYLVRQINQLTQMLAQIIFRKQQGQHDEALEAIRHTGELFLGLDVQAVDMLTPEVLQEAMKAKNAEDAEQAALVAELLHHQGDCFAAQQLAGPAEASYRLALHLYLGLWTSGQAAPADLSKRIDALLDPVDLFVLPPGTLHTLFRYLDDAGHYALAEDVLFHLADVAPTPDLFAEGEAFFTRLLKETPYRRLEAGGLPYEEAVEGLQAFRRKRQA